MTIKVALHSSCWWSWFVTFRPFRMTINAGPLCLWREWSDVELLKLLDSGQDFVTVKSLKQ